MWRSAVFRVSAFFYPVVADLVATSFAFVDVFLFPGEHRSALPAVGAPEPKRGRKAAIIPPPPKRFPYDVVASADLGRREKGRRFNGCDHKTSFSQQCFRRGRS
jgi:hypothetical protein